MTPIYVVDYNNGMIQVLKDFDHTIERLEWSLNSGPFDSLPNELPQDLFDAGIEIPKLHRLVRLASDTKIEGLDIVIHDADSRATSVTEIARYHMIDNEDPDCLLSCAILELVEADEDEFEEAREEIWPDLEETIRATLKKRDRDEGVVEALESLKPFQQAQSIAPHVDDIETMNLNDIISGFVERARERFDRAARCLAPKALTP